MAVLCRTLALLVLAGLLLLAGAGTTAPSGIDYDLDNDGLLKSEPWRSSTPYATTGAPG